MKYRTAFLVGGAALVLAGSAAQASQLVYRPINPTFGGDPLNGNWLLSQGTAQQEDGSGSGSGASGFTIDFPDFSGVEQAPAVNPVTLPDVPTTPATPPQP